jgi:predicted N-acetyltransferase YhbS
MEYRIMTEDDLQYVAEKYTEYYNTVEECCWTHEKAYKRIHQVLTMEDSMCMVQTDQEGNITGYLMGYFKEYDDIRGYFLEEIVIFMGHQGKGYGTAFMKHLEEVVRENGASIVELSSVNDDKHEKFYSGLGFYPADNFVLMSKFME